MELQRLNIEKTTYCTGFAESRIGGRLENQDTFDSVETSRGFLVTVCDGMGGGPGGKTASSIAVNEIISGIKEANDDEETANVIIKAVRRANIAILEAGNMNPALKGMGSTATVLLISEYSAYVAHVGDSRVYQIRGKRKVFRTFDHSMVFELVQQKVITEEQARLSANSNIITRALGINPDVQVDVTELAYEKGDRFVLCSDGIHGMLPEKDLLKMIANKKASLGAVTDDIATVIDNIGRSEGGEHDNLTIAIIETNRNSKLKPKMSKQLKSGILLLSTVCIISIASNIILVSANGRQPDYATQLDSLKSAQNREYSVSRDSIKRLNDTIASLRLKIDKIQNTIK